MKVIGYKLSYKCMKHNDFQNIICETKRELDGFLYDMKKYLTDYKITKLLQCDCSVSSI